MCLGGDFFKLITQASNPFFLLSYLLFGVSTYLFHFDVVLLTKQYKSELTFKEAFILNYWGRIKLTHI